MKGSAALYMKHWNWNLSCRASAAAALEGLEGGGGEETGAKGLICSHPSDVCGRITRAKGDPRGNERCSGAGRWREALKL